MTEACACLLCGVKLQCPSKKLLSADAPDSLPPASPTAPAQTMVPLRKEALASARERREFITTAIDRMLCRLEQSQAGVEAEYIEALQAIDKQRRAMLEMGATHVRDTIKQLSAFVDGLEITIAQAESYSSTGTMPAALLERLTDTEKPTVFDALPSTWIGMRLRTSQVFHRVRATQAFLPWEDSCYRHMVASNAIAIEFASLQPSEKIDHGDVAIVSGKATPCPSLSTPQQLVFIDCELPVVLRACVKEVLTINEAWFKTTDGAEMYMKDGRLHREGDKPAKIHMGKQEYFVNGVRHRENGQPAVYNTVTHEGAVWERGQFLRMIGSGMRSRSERVNRGPVVI